MKGTKGKASKFRERAYSTRSDASSMSGLKDVCRICHWYAEARGTDNQVEELIFPCACLYAGVHQRCIYKWASKMKSNVCEVCDQKFDPKYVPEIKQPYINWNFVPSYTRRRSIIASIILTFLVAITVITSYLLVKTLMKGENIKDSMHIVWPLIAVVSICCMGLICFVTWFCVFCRETVKEYSEASKKHMRRIEEA
ncbi:E3 ubiquitin-protein ligase MARCHF2-like [Ptychodera flava]|uniref:E3 ubiquitin-protein ligase MARCHF2-like n=1 Tax=Ptychodera flava TaxID=63121 RepID=UPI00396AA7C3